MIGLIIVQGQHGNHQERDSQHGQIQGVLDSLPEFFVRGDPAQSAGATPAFPMSHPGPPIGGEGTGNTRIAFSNPCSARTRAERLPAETRARSSPARRGMRSARAGHSAGRPKCSSPATNKRKATDATNIGTGVTRSSFSRVTFIVPCRQKSEEGRRSLQSGGILLRRAVSIKVEFEFRAIGRSSGPSLWCQTLHGDVVKPILNARMEPRSVILSSVHRWF